MADALSSDNSVFVSYSHYDREIAERLVSLLVLNGIPVWWDEWNVLIGDSIFTRVAEGVSACQYLTILLSKQSLSSRWVQEELDMAKVREFENRSVVILPLKIEEVELPLALKTKRCADFTDFELGFNQLMARLRPGQNSLIAGSADWRAFRDVIVNSAHPVGDGPVNLILSQNQARLIQPAAFQLMAQESISHLQKQDNTVIYFHFRAASATLPMLVSLSETCREVVARLAKALLLPEAFSAARANYVLVYEGRPLEMASTLKEENVTPGATLNLACLTYLIE